MASDAESFAALYRDHYRHVYAYCRRRTDADATDDLVAEVFLTLWRRIDDAPHDADKLLPWLYRIAYLTTSNHWRTRRRRNRLQAKLDSVGLPPADLVPDQIVQQEEVREAVNLLGELKPADQEIIKLSVWEGLSHEDIAAVLDLAPETTRQRLHRARKRLADLYSKRHTHAVSPAAQEGGER